jgi:hypothetical protein
MTVFHVATFPCLISRFGLQIADFYAGAVRKMFLDSVNGLESNLSSPYDRLQHQISLEDYIDLESQKAEP